MTSTLVAIIVVLAIRGAPFFPINPELGMVAKLILQSNNPKRTTRNETLWRHSYVELIGCQDYSFQQS
ncbi:hypothetical protein HYALB_00000314 [Hymenoscyphus albidus]|uniref:Uncharacterized protein n=1 Tax=Hymenoscyphus albidus TaxID=595503 RepID=A0A9N9LVG6_9HELO|nr:hypothetical protein HYALB_00000314 [Hymenoscyphus albidus]